MYMSSSGSRIASVILGCVVLMQCAAAGQANSTPSGGETLWLVAKGLRIKTVIYRSAKLTAHPVLVVVLHGDLPKPSYHYEFSRRAAMKMDDVVVAALLRPGYTDGAGDHSEGEMGQTTGDNYTPAVVDTVADAVGQLQKNFHPARTVLAGHSGGAAITADLLGRWPTLVDAALLVSCPCDVPAWRKHMQEVQRDPIWSAPVKSLSPMDLADKVSRSVRVQMVVGGDDPVAPLELSRRYAGELRKYGHNVGLTVLPGLKHNILLEPAALEALEALVQAKH
jgi:pimeloyl-ACP methyl ester carboxylesterase